MAHTLNGNLTGRAAVTERREIKQEIEDAQNRQIHAMWEQKEEDAMQACVELEGYAAFKAWFDDDNNVPPYCLTTQRVDLIHKHWSELKAREVPHGV